MKLKVTFMFYESSRSPVPALRTPSPLMTMKPEHSNHIEPETCSIVRLAGNEIVAVDRCSCGTLRVHLGALTLRVNAEGLQAIMHTLNEALVANASLKAKRSPSLSAAALGLSKAPRGQS